MDLNNGSYSISARMSINIIGPVPVCGNARGELCCLLLFNINAFFVTNTNYAVQYFQQIMLKAAKGTLHEQGLITAKS